MKDAVYRLRHKRHLMKTLSTLLCLVIAGSTAQAQALKKGKQAPPKLTYAVVKNEERLYKTTPQGELKLHFSFPQDWRATDKRPAIVCFFGGGWKNGSFTQFVSLCDYLASRGMVAASVDYRIESIHHTTPDKCVEDAKSAVRFLRGHAHELGIDPDRIVASGGSAGGHLAACTALIEGFDAETDNKAVSAIPNALVMFNPALNIDELMPGTANAEKKAMAAAITPNRYIKAGTPPAIMFFGSADKLIAGATQYLAKAKPLSLRAELWTARDEAHGFFNHAPWIQVTAKKADEFLVSLGYLSGKPEVRVPEGAVDLVRKDN